MDRTALRLTLLEMLEEEVGEKYEGLSEDQSLRDGLGMGAKDFVDKPFHVVEVLLRIRNLLEARFLHLLLHDEKAVLKRQVEDRTRELFASQTEVLDRLAQISPEGGPARVRTSAEPPLAPRWAESSPGGDLFNRGLVHHNQGNYQLAIADFTEALKLDPNNALVLATRGDAYRMQGEYDKALADFTEALRLDPTNAVAHINQGIAHRLPDMSAQ